MTISIIAAVAQNNVIGFKGKIPWRMPADLQHLKNLTTNKIAILGMNTYISMESYYDQSGRPMPAKKYLVLADTNFKPKRSTAFPVKSFEKAFEKAQDETEVFIIGGASVYAQAVEFADKIYLTKIKHKFDGDTYFPEINMAEWKEVSKEEHKADEKNLYDYEFLVLEKK